MRYTERKIETHLDNPFDYIRILFSCILLSPFRLFNEISKKLLYIKKEVLEKVLLISIIFSAFTLAFNIICGFISRRLDFIGGNLPIISQLLTLLLLSIIYYVLIMSPFSLYSICSSYDVDSSDIIGENKENNIKESSDVSNATIDNMNLDLKDLDLEEKVDCTQNVDGLTEFCNQDIANFQADLREDEFFRARENLQNSVNEDKYNLAGVIDKFIETDFLDENFDISWDESQSQSLLFYDQKPNE